MTGVVDLVALLAAAELTGFERLAADARLAPTFTAEAALASLACSEFRHFELLRDRLVSLGVDPDPAMAPFAAALAEFHSRTSPSDWLEGLVKAYIGDGIATDFYREIAAYVDEPTRNLVNAVCSDTGFADFAVSQIRSAIAAEPTIGGRLALWARRLVGEAISQAQRVAADNAGLTTLLLGSGGHTGADLVELRAIIDRLTEGHVHRMGRLGLAF